jgi:hypothetical protein
MKINFFDQDCQTITNEIEFGLCDDPPPSNAPAYIDITNSLGWIATVQNADATEVTFTAIDHCIDIRRDNGEMDSRCDAMLIYEDKIIFLELKERNSGKWFKKAEDQLRATISTFGANNNLNSYSQKTAYVANKLKPNFQSGNAEKIEKFRNDTGFILRTENKISIS